MTAVKASDVDRAVKARGAGVGILLFYGPDTGRIAERAGAAARSAVDDPDDPFQLVRLSGDQLADEPGRLVEEASTFGLFGGRRAIWVRPTSRNITLAVGACLDRELADTLVVIEGVDLPKSSPLRSLCEKSSRALALPCYPDEARDLSAMVGETASAAGLKIDPDARTLLVESLGGDRLASRGELEKLLLFVHGRDEITVADVEAVICDVSGPSIDAALDAAFLGDRAGLDDALVALGRASTPASALLPLALRHGLALLGLSDRIASGQNADAALKTWRGLNFRREAAIRRQIRLWSGETARRAVGLIQSAILDSRRIAALSETLSARCLHDIASVAGRLGRSGG